MALNKIKVIIPNIIHSLDTTYLINLIKTASAEREKNLKPFISTAAL